MSIHPDVACKECQIAANQVTNGAYNFNCNDCCARYVIDMIVRISGNRAPAVKDSVFQLLAKDRT